MPTRRGSFRLFRLWGIDVYLHWTWFAWLFIRYQLVGEHYPSLAWYALEYLALFFTVLLHEFGHALACRQVGGQANQIFLWPLGGVAFVSPPLRPGAVLWSIAAGPLVNVALFGLSGGLWLLDHSLGWAEAIPTFQHFIGVFALINLVLLAFNLLPIYPLDGGQMLQALLWFFFGRARSLTIATVIGFVGAAALIPLAVWSHNPISYVMIAFIALNCWRGFQMARSIGQLENAPRRQGFACPACHAAPPLGAFWVCGKCRNAFDTFATLATCPHCRAQYSVATCAACGSMRPISEWLLAPPLPPKV